MLRTCVQSQLEGIRTAIGQLQSATDDIKNVEQRCWNLIIYSQLSYRMIHNFSTQEIYDYLEHFPDLRAKLKKIRDANAKHCQYATAMDNLKHIDNVPGKVEKIHAAITEGKLLVAHKE
jgi:exocyst complex component 3